jgi:PAS domain S-box-containing protein
MLGYEEKELQHMTFRDITHKDDIEIGNKVIKRLIDGEETRHERLEKRYVRKDGTIIDTSLTTSLIRDISGAPQYFFTQIVDITERKRGEDKLRETQGLLEAAMDASHAGIAIADAPSGRLRYVNKAGLNIAGEDRENLVNGVESAHYAETWQIMDLDGRLLDPDEIPLARAVMFGETNSREFVIRRQSGDERIVAANAAPVRNALDEVFAGVVVFLDITERKRAEQRLEHLNQVLRSIRDINQLIVRERDPETLIAEGCRLLVENRGFASVVIILTDPGGQVTGWAASGSASDESEKIADMIEQNEIPACCAIAPSDNEVVVIDKRSDLCRQCPLLVTHTNAPSLCARLSHGGNVYGFIIAALNFDMTVDEEERDLFVEIAGDFAYAINFIRMEAEALLSAKQRDKMQAQLIQAQKMESVGRLAGGVAHDYNNMLTIIIGYAEMALDKVVPDDALHTDISEIFNAAQRSSEITKQLLAFSRQQTTQPRIIDLNETIDKTLKMLRRLIGEDIDLAWMPSPNVWSVYVDPVQIDQILANLCANARDAIDGTGQVTIETKNVTFDQDYCATHAGFLPGEYVHIGVSDNGSGMSAETRDKVFEPFFTTK